MNRIFNNESANRFDKARLILGTMSPDMVEDIVELVKIQGREVIQDVFSEDSPAADVPRFFAPLSREFVRDQDVPSLILGYATIILGSFKKLDWDFDYYRNLLKDGWSLPAVLADQIAHRVYTENKVSTDSGAMSLADVKSISDGWNFISSQIQESTRKVMNTLPAILQIPWEIDQNPKYNTDFLFELSLLGEEIAKLQRRTRLITAQASITKSMGLLGRGDVDNIHPQVRADHEFGDVLGSIMKASKGLSKILSGKKKAGDSVHQAASEAAMNNLVAMLAKAGYAVDTQGIREVAPPESPEMRQAIDKARAGRISPAMNAGIQGADIKTLAKGNDSYQAQIQQIAEDHGPLIAEAYRRGDLDSIVKAAFIDSGRDVDSGDPELDAQIEKELAQELAVETSGMTPEIGGLFSRWKLNRKKRKYRRRLRKSKRKARRQEKRRAREFATDEYDQQAANLDPRDYQASDDELRAQAQADFEAENQDDNDLYNNDPNEGSGFFDAETFNAQSAADEPAY